MINKKELAKILAKKNGTTNSEELDHINSIFDTIEDLLKEKKDVNIVGFGAFKNIERKPRTIINPSTLEYSQVGTRIVFKFVAGKRIRDIYKDEK